MLKATAEFSLHKGCSGGVRPECKSCYNHAQKADVERFITKIYKTQRASSVKRWHAPPTYTRDQLADWIKSQKNFARLWDAYQSAGQLKDLAPSVDRLDPNLPYTLGNIELTTWEVNNKRGHASSKVGERVSQHRAVAGTSKNGTIGPFVSLHEAARAVGGNPTNIQRVADKTVVTKPDGRTTVPKSSKGYNWNWV